MGSNPHSFAHTFEPRSAALASLDPLRAVRTGLMSHRFRRGLMAPGLVPCRTACVAIASGGA
jgi:hypothetical protein